MPIDLTPRLRELGRIRTGQRVGKGKGRPTKLETFRLTSTSEALIREAAQMFGGEAKPWHNPSGGGDEWEVVTDRAWLQVLVPPPFDLSANQAWELWSADGPQRRCNGSFQYDGEECLCPRDYAERMEEAAKGKACKPTTRLKVMLPGIPDVGTWRLESHGFYAAVELAASMAVFAWLKAERPVPAILRLEQRTKKVAGGADLKYAVPVLELQAALDRVLEAAGQDDVLQLVPDRPGRQLKASTPPSEATDQTETGKAPEVEVSEAAVEDPAGGVEPAALAVGVDPPPAWDIAEHAKEIERLCGLIGADTRDKVLRLLGVAPEKMTQAQQERFLPMLEKKVRDKEQRTAHEGIGE